MSSLPHVNDLRSPKYGIPLFILLVAAGLSGNYYPISILNLHFILGSVFALLALQIFGLGWGILAAVIISSYTYLNWNHPYAIITMTAEAAIAGWLFSRRRVTLVMADTLYWLLIGLPLGFCCFYFIAHLSVSDAVFLMMKQSINGITNALIARLIFTGYALPSRSSTISFRENLSNLMLFFAILPMLILLISGGRVDFEYTEHQIRKQLLHDSLQATDSLNNWIQERENIIAQLAIMAKTFAPAQMQTRLAEVRALDRNFLRTVLIDKKGTAVAYSPPKDDLGRDNIGKNFGDRPYIPPLKDGLKPMLSEVMTSRFGRTGIVTIVLAPVVSQGKYEGAVGGIINFDRIKTILETSFPGHSTLYTLVDRKGRVILTNRKDQTAMAPFSRGEGSNQPISETFSQWIPSLPSNISTIELWGRSLYVVETAIGQLGEWRLILEQPVAPFQAILYNRYSSKVVIMFIILILLLGIAALFSRRLASTGEQLSRVTAGLPEKVASNQTIDWPESGIEDIRHLVANFKEMAASLQAQFREVKKINESLESQIEARTQELQASKDKLSSAVEIARLGHWEYDVAKDLFTFNDSFYRIFLTTADQAGGYTMTSAEYTRRFVHSEDAPMVGEEIRKAMETTDPGFSRQLEHRILRADGTTGHISVRYFVVKDAHGKTVKTYGVNQDITDRKHAEKEHKNLQAQLSQAQKMESVGRLAGGVAHDFNNQLSVILGYTELAIGDLDKSDSIYSTLQEVLNAGKRSANIVRQLLAFARKQSISPKVIDLNDTIESMLKMLRRLIGEDIDLKWNPDNRLWYVKMDPSQVDQILANLCVNARDAIEGNGKITIETLNVAIDQVYCATHEGFLPGEYVMLGFSDDGSGMDPQTLVNIFEPFFTTKGLGEGTGLGLSTVYGIVKQNEGFINTYSEPDKGTTFKIYLPRYKGETKSEVEKQSEEIPKSEGETILIVEDDRTVLQMAKETLEKLGYTVLAMDSPTDTLNMVEEYSDDIHLLMTDVIMPEMDGKQLAEAIKNLRKGIKIIYMSGYTANTIAHHGVLDKGVNFIEKPFSIHSLAHKIREVLDKISKKQV